MKFEEALKLLRNGKKVRRPEWEKGTYICMTPGGLLINEKDEITTTAYIDVNWEEYKISLMQHEKDVLENQLDILRGFGAEVDCVYKYEVDDMGTLETVQINYRQGEECWSTSLPLFKKDTMFKELKLEEAYSLEELGLE